jgi:tetratricopeptide (TPR) repeat protein
MNIKYMMLALVLAAGFATAMAQNDDAAVRQRINEAVLKVYDEQLAKEPNDYSTLLARANQYYYFGRVDDAMTDVNSALALIPTKEKEMRYDALMLRARLFDQQGAFEGEIADLTEAANLVPSSLACTDMLAKVCLKVGRLDEAEANFKAIQRAEPLNYDAMYGMAQVALKRNDFEAATNHVDKAVGLFAAEPQVYINRADILERMNQFEPAALDLVSAFSIGDKSGVALQRLVTMADAHYDQVMSALGTTIDKAPRGGLFYYIRASIAMDHFHYGQALKDLKSIIDNNLYDYHSVFYKAARCQYELMQYVEALNNVNRAIAMNESGDADYLLLKAQCERRMGNGDNFDTAMNTLSGVAAIDGKHLGTLLEQARIHIAKRESRPAMIYLNAAIDYTDQPSAEALLLRGWLNKYRNNDAVTATADFERVAQLNDDTAHGLRGFALHELGRADEAKQWAQKIVENTSMAGGEAYYYAAALYSDMGEDKLAIEAFKKCLANGFGSLFEVRANEDPYVNLKLVRRLADFETLMSQSQINFQERR